MAQIRLGEDPCRAPKPSESEVKKVQEMFSFLSKPWNSGIETESLDAIVVLSNWYDRISKIRKVLDLADAWLEEVPYGAIPRVRFVELMLHHVASRILSGDVHSCKTATLLDNICIFDDLPDCGLKWTACLPLTFHGGGDSTVSIAKIKSFSDLFNFKRL